MTKELDNDMRETFEVMRGQGYSMNEARVLARQHCLIERAHVATTVEELRAIVIELLERSEW